MLCLASVSQIKKGMIWRHNDVNMPGDGQQQKFKKTGA
jgi:hypothetical protein